MGTGGVDIEIRKDIHPATGEVSWRAHRTLGGADLCPPSPRWNGALERELRGSREAGPMAVWERLSELRPDLAVWVDALQEEEQDALLTLGWVKPESGDPTVIPPDP